MTYVRIYTGILQDCMPTWIVELLHSVYFPLIHLLYCTGKEIKLENENAYYETMWDNEKIHVNSVFICSWRNTHAVPMLNQRMTFLLGPEAQEPFFKCNDNALSLQECYSFMKPVFGPGVVYDVSKSK